MNHSVMATAGPLIMALALFFSPFLHGRTDCGDCHPGAAPEHGGEAVACVACHQGRAEAPTIEQGHQGLINRPGELSNAAASCGQCHPEQWAGVRASPMHTGLGMVAVTRRVFGEAAGAAPNLQTLGDGIADSLLRKLCASCHLGQAGTSIGSPEIGPIAHRGGGCLACHLDPDEMSHKPAGHPRLTRKISDARCLGCHSRSARISLNYAGLAEVDPPGPGEPWTGLSRLADGRLVEHKTADVHQRAGLSCIDCHTGAGLMGQMAGVDISCTDCHANRRPSIATNELSPGLMQQRHRLGLPRDDHVGVPQTGHGTPLWHLSRRQDGVWLHPKPGGGPRRIPQIETGHFESPEQHRILSCDACHATWAPQCYGCHLDFDPDQEQWDHLEQRETKGRWRERRWAVRNDLPPLGVDRQGVVRPAVPGMVMSVEHQDLPASLFIRRFATSAPHTTGRSRRCNDCHGSTRALGLGEGALRREDKTWHFRPSRPILIDGLAVDAWTSLERGNTGSVGDAIAPFSRDDLHRLSSPVE